MSTLIHVTIFKTSGLVGARKGRRARSRNELMGLSDRDLQDIGVDRCSADFEASKPFWMV